MGDSFHVESHDQSGGITAGQVNFGQPPVILSDNQKRKLSTLLETYKDKELSVTHMMGNVRARELSLLLISYLKENGWRVNDIPNQAVYMNPPNCVAINPESEKVKLDIGIV